MSGCLLARKKLADVPTWLSTEIDEASEQALRCAVESIFEVERTEELADLLRNGSA